MKVLAVVCVLVLCAAVAEGARKACGTLEVAKVAQFGGSAWKECSSAKPDGYPCDTIEGFGSGEYYLFEHFAEKGHRNSSGLQWGKQPAAGATPDTKALSGSFKYCAFQRRVGTIDGKFYFVASDNPLCWASTPFAWKLFEFDPANNTLTPLVSYDNEQLPDALFFLKNWILYSVYENGTTWKFKYWDRSAKAEVYKWPGRVTGGFPTFNRKVSGKELFLATRVEPTGLLSIDISNMDMVEVLDNTTTHVLEEGLPNKVVYLDGVVYHPDASNQKYCKIWRTDLTKPGTRVLKDFCAGTIAMPGLARAGDYVYTVANASKLVRWNTEDIVTQVHDFGGVQQAKVWFQSSGLGYMVPFFLASVQTTTAGIPGFDVYSVDSSGAVTKVYATRPNGYGLWMGDGGYGSIATNGSTQWPWTRYVSTYGTPATTIIGPDIFEIRDIQWFSYEPGHVINSTQCWFLGTELGRLVYIDGPKNDSISWPDPPSSVSYAKVCESTGDNAKLAVIAGSSERAIYRLYSKPLPPGGDVSAARVLLSCSVLVFCALLV